MPTHGALSRPPRRRRRRRGVRKGISSNLVPHPTYSWLRYDPRGVAEVEGSRDLRKRLPRVRRPEPGDASAEALPASGLALS